MLTLKLTISHFLKGNSDHIAEMRDGTSSSTIYCYHFLNTMKRVN
jgi:hypothetical protein